MTERREFDEIKGNKCNTTKAVAISLSMIEIATFSVIIISSQLVYAQNAIANKESNNQTSMIASNGSMNLKLGSKAYPIKYQITGGKLAGISAEKDNATLLINVSSTSNGKLIVELPRYVIDSKKQGNVDDTFAVFEDGQYAVDNEIRTNAQSRTVMVGFDNGTSVIEITGTHIVPEFATVAIVVFAIATIGIIVVARKYKVLPVYSK
ncbi:MAG TPA: PEFG-CTERM sorting domain-containing protein [Candidatus Nitrosopolaris sp.]|nr:PEFG-CTERM sorting domain-containing protein [Candidatus Nitrosopolaris sp.]